MPRRTFEEVVLKTILPPPGKKWTRSSVTLPDDVWEALDRVAELENAERSAPERLSRERLMAYFLEWAVTEYDAERAKKKK